MVEAELKEGDSEKEKRINQWNPKVPSSFLAGLGEDMEAAKERRTQQSAKAMAAAKLIGKRVAKTRGHVGNEATVSKKDIVKETE